MLRAQAQSASGQGASYRGYGFFESLVRGFVNWRDFSGRATLSEYWWWRLWNVLFSLVQFILIFVLGEFWANVVSWVICVGFIVPDLSVTVRRLHDSSLSSLYIMFYAALIVIHTAVELLTPQGDAKAFFILDNALLWWCYVAFMFVCAVVGLILTLRDSTCGSNEYGPSLKYPDTED